MLAPKRGHKWSDKGAAGHVLVHSHLLCADLMAGLLPSLSAEKGVQDSLERDAGRGCFANAVAY